MQEFAFEDFGAFTAEPVAPLQQPGAIAIAPLPGEPDPAAAAALLDAVAAARAEADAIREAAYAEGFEAGRREAVAAAAGAAEALSAAVDHQQGVRAER